MILDNEEAIKILKNEYECVKRAESCNRDCKNCDLVMDSDKILQAYELAIKSLKSNKWILCKDDMPEEHEWVGTKMFGTTISNEVLVTIEIPSGERFVRCISFQNQDLSKSDKQTLNAFYKGGKAIAWMKEPEPYKEDIIYV